jgi:hypothetical protein
MRRSNGIRASAGRNLRQILSEALDFRRTNKVTLEFAFDRWNATSTSAWAGWLSGSKNITSIMRVGTIRKRGRRPKDRWNGRRNCPKGFSGFQSRDYANPEMPMRNPGLDLGNDGDLFDLDDEDD